MTEDAATRIGGRVTASIPHFTHVPTEKLCRFVIRNVPFPTASKREHMKLSEKGRFSPPPTLPKHAQVVSTALASWADVHARTHWLLGDETRVDGADFYVGESEIGHLHLEGQAHVATGVALRNALVAEKLASPFRYSSNFVVHDVARAADVEHALWLFRLAYDRAQGVTEEELISRVHQYER